MVVRLRRAIGRVIIKKQPNVVRFKSNVKKQKIKPKQAVIKRKTKSRIMPRLEVSMKVNSTLIQKMIILDHLSRSMQSVVK